MIDKDEKNEIDESFKAFISKVKPPDSNKDWLEYINMLWGIAYSEGVDFTFKTMRIELDKIDEKGD